MFLPPQKIPTEIPIVLVLQIAFLILQLIMKGVAEEEAINTIASTHGVSKDQTRQMYGGW